MTDNLTDAVKEYYVVRVLLRPTPSGLPLRWWWLASDAWGRSHSSVLAGAERFKSQPDDAAIAAFSGSPWMDVHDGPREIYRIEETRKVTKL